MMHVKVFQDYERGKVLLHLLESNIGQLWDEVYSKICSIVDPRTEMGWRFRKRIDWYVHSKYSGLYVDINGILCKKDKKKYNDWRQPHSDETEIDFIVIPDDVVEYIKIDGSWFKVWVDEIEDTYPVDIILDEDSKRGIYAKVVPCIKHVEHKAQLSKKDVKDIIIPNLSKGTNKKFMERVRSYIPASKWNS